MHWLHGTSGVSSHGRISAFRGCAGLPVGRPAAGLPDPQIGDAMTPPLPRVTYSNVADDFSARSRPSRCAPAGGAGESPRADRPNLIAGREDEDGVRYTAPSPDQPRLAARQLLCRLERRGRSRRRGRRRRLSGLEPPAVGRARRGAAPRRRSHREPEIRDRLRLPVRSRQVAHGGGRRGRGGDRPHPLLLRRDGGERAATTARCAGHSRRRRPAACCARTASLR